MITSDERTEAHDRIDHILGNLFPAHGMMSRPAQIALSHQVLDAMLDSRIALFDAGTGIGKTYAYLVAGAVFDRCRAAGGWVSNPSSFRLPALPCKMQCCMNIFRFYRLY